MIHLSNEVLFFLYIFIDFIIAILIFYFFKKEGLFILIVFNIIVCNIQVLKTIPIFGFVSTTGNILYGSIFFATDILSELYGKKEAKKGVILGFIFMLIFTLYMQITLLFAPDKSDFIQPHLKAIFSLTPRIALASLLAYWISQNYDVWAFHFIKKFTKEKWLWLRNNLSTFSSQLIDTLVFSFLAFWGLFSLDVFLQILFTTYILKIIVALFDTPFIYLAKYITLKRDINLNDG